MRRMWAGICSALLIGACAAGEISLNEYVERVNTIVNRASGQYEALVTSPHGAVLIVDAAQLTDLAPQDLQLALERVREIEAEVDEAISAIEPPEQVADLHYLFFDFDDGFIAAQEALAAKAGTTADWETLSESVEMAAYRAALAADKAACASYEIKLNSIAEGREEFADTPWIPGELKEVFEAALSCDGYPENPEDMYRPLPASSP